MANTLQNEGLDFMSRPSLALPRPAKPCRARPRPAQPRHVKSIIAQEGTNGKWGYGSTGSVGWACTSFARSRLWPGMPIPAISIIPPISHVSGQDAMPRGSVGAAVQGKR